MNPDFETHEVETPAGFKDSFTRIVLVEKLREVRTVIGFTRIESPGDFSETSDLPPERQTPLSRKAPTWVPACEIRGEGIFIQFNEEKLGKWLARGEIKQISSSFMTAHSRWREARGLPNIQAGYPGIRFVLIHSFAHALIREFALECGYSAAGLRERIYARNPEDGEEAMAGVLIYTSAPDSEGTLGGLVHLGRTENLGGHLRRALDSMRLCASDPHCAEHETAGENLSLHRAACHACLFASETSCERGNRYLDRSLLVDVFNQKGIGFFSSTGKTG